MGRQKKYIIVKDWNGRPEIRIGYPFFHRDLLTKEDDKNNIDCYGGGMWDLNYEDKSIILYGKSDDFGQPKKEDIEQAIKNLTDDDWVDISWVLERIYDEQYPNETWEDVFNYKFKIDYEE